jgi:hypothetical protein
MGGCFDKKGRETGGMSNIPPVPSALYLSAFAMGYGRKGGTFMKHSVFSNLIIVSINSSNCYH